MSLIPYLGRGSLTGEAPAAGLATTAPTASALVQRTTSGYLKDRTDDSACFLPNYRRLIAELGYTGVNGYWRCQNASGDLKSEGNASEQTLAAVTSPTYNYFANGFRGIYMDTDGDAFGNADVLDFGTSSAHVAIAFYLATAGVTRGLIGRYAAERALRFDIGNDDLLKLAINDGTRSSQANVSATVLTAGSIYLAQFHLRKDAGTLKARLSKWGTGLVSAEYSLDVSAYTTLAGGTTPKFNICLTDNWGTGIAVLGAMVRIGTNVEATERMSTLASMVGIE